MGRFRVQFDRGAGWEWYGAHYHNTVEPRSDMERWARANCIPYRLVDQDEKVILEVQPPARVRK